MTFSVFCLLGPTATGKTALACELTQTLPLEVISVDSAMIYREMNIGTAKPSPSELQQTPHHLIDILNPPDVYSAAQFCTDALALIETIKQRGKFPLLVGGTMLYFNALQGGLSVLPQANEAFRATFDLDVAQQGLGYLYQQLVKADPVAALKIHPNDEKRIQRALEVYHLSGQPLSSHWKQKLHSNQKLQFVNFILIPPQRSWLHERIALRFDAMLQQGFVAEVDGLLKKWGLSSTCPAMQCAGYRQIYEYLAGRYDSTEMQQRGIAATRQLAKRQITWLRQWPQEERYPAEDRSTSRHIMAKIAEIIDNRV